MIVNICRISEEREPLVPDVPVCPDSEAFYVGVLQGRIQIKSIRRESFSDSESLRIFDGIIEARPYRIAFCSSGVVFLR